MSDQITKATASLLFEASRLLFGDQQAASEPWGDLLREYTEKKARRLLNQQQARATEAGR